MALWRIGYLYGVAAAQQSSLLLAAGSLWGVVVLISNFYLAVYDPRREGTITITVSEIHRQTNWLMDRTLVSVNDLNSCLSPLSPRWVKKKVKAQEISQHRASRYGLGTLEQCSVKAGDGPFLRNDNSLILQSKISPFFHGFLQVLDCGDPLGP